MKRFVLLAAVLALNSACGQPDTRSPEEMLSEAKLEISPDAVAFPAPQGELNVTAKASVGTPQIEITDVIVFAKPNDGTNAPASWRPAGEGLVPFQTSVSNGVASGRVLAGKPARFTLRFSTALADGQQSVPVERHYCLGD